MDILSIRVNVVTQPQNIVSSLLSREIWDTRGSIVNISIQMITVFINFLFILF